VRTARQISHPNVCRVYDIGEAEGLTYLTIEYIEGEDLASLLQRIGKLPHEVERYGLAQQQIVGAVNLTHAATSEQMYDSVTLYDYHPGLKL
jgi:serine/threonine protein kinase